MTGIYCIGVKMVNMHQVTQHWAILMNWLLQSFILLLHVWALMVQWALLGKKSREIKLYFTSTVLAQQGVNKCDLNETWALLAAEKGIMSCSVTFWLTQSIWFVPLSDVVPQCLRQLLPCCFNICDRSVAWAVWDPLIVDVQSTNIIIIFHLWLIWKSSEPFVKPVCNKRKAKAICKKTK